MEPILRKKFLTSGVAYCRGIIYQSGSEVQHDLSTGILEFLCSALEGRVVPRGGPCSALCRARALRALADAIAAIRR